MPTMKIATSGNDTISTTVAAAADRCGQSSRAASICRPPKWTTLPGRYLAIWARMAIAVGRSVRPVRSGLVEASSEPHAT